MTMATDMSRSIFGRHIGIGRKHHSVPDAETAGVACRSLHQRELGHGGAIQKER